MGLRPMVIDEAVKTRLSEIAKLAEENPVDMPALMESIKTPTGKHQHMRQMTAQTMEIPFGYMVTYSIETGQPVGDCRHMSMSVDNPNNMPHPVALWEIAKLLGFWGELSDVDGMYPEKLFRGVDEAMGLAINIIQRKQRPTTQ